MNAEYDPTSSRNDVEFTSSNLPVVIIQTEAKTLTNKEKTLATMKIIDNGDTRNRITDPANGYDGKSRSSYAVTHRCSLTRSGLPSRP